MKLTQSKLVELVAAKAHITHSEANRLIATLKTVIYEQLAQGNTVQISGFGTFSVSHRLAREGVNPRTLERIMIPELNTPKFVAGQALKNAVALKH